MKIYADTGPRRARQITSDVLFVLWCGLWVWLAVRLHALIVPLAAPGEKLTEVGDSLTDNMASAGQAVGGLPFVGDEIREPFDRVSQAGQSLADAGRGQQEVVERLALFLPLALAFLAISVLLAVWLPLRLRFISRATAAERYLHVADDVDLFALRALARQPLTALLRIDADPAAAWRRGDPAVITALADLELASEGIRRPPPGGR
ncbi:MAG: hypothetical protein H6525_02815 [Actinobacteria bacterium]|nr:hypothetical protein [Actinomycetota bacterium]MCB9411772.1 hypothetical protein [Actinomycetota bacterium]